MTDVRDSRPAIASTQMTPAEKRCQMLLKHTQAVTQAITQTKLDGARQEAADSRNAARRGQLAVAASASGGLAGQVQPGAGGMR